MSARVVSSPPAGTIRMNWGTPACTMTIVIALAPMFMCTA